MTRNKEAQAAMSARKLFYLGPQGTFTHQAAVNAAQELARLEPQGFDLMPMDDVPQILDAAQHGDGWGIVAWENNVEGYVVPNLDALIDAKDLVGFARVGVNVEFDAYVAQGADPAEARIATAHPHGLAQCKRFIAEHRLSTQPATSNAAACRDLIPGEIAFGPAICGELYDITRIGTAIELARRQADKWWMMLLFSVLSIALGILLLVNPFGAAVSVVMLCGVLLIIEGVVNLSCVVYTAMELRTLDRMQDAAMSAALGALGDALDEAEAEALNQDHEGVVYNAESTELPDDGHAPQ